MARNHQFIYGRLARRLSIYVILASTLITIFTSIFQIYSEYQHDIRKLHAEFEHIKNTHLTNISARVWVLDTKELRTTLNSLLSFRSVRYITVYDNKILSISIGKDITSNVIEKQYPLTHKHGGKIVNIGKLVVKITLDDAYQRIIDRATIIIISNAFKTFIVAGLILIIFYYMVARHLNKFSKFAEQLNIDTLQSQFEFDRKKNPRGRPDELDLLKNAVSHMQKNLMRATQNLQNSMGALQEREQNLAITLNSIGDAVIVTDAEGLVTRMNPVAQSLTGWSLQEALGKSVKSVFTIIQADTREPIKNPIEKVISSGQIVFFSNNTTLIAKDNTEYQIADSAAPIRNGNEKILGMVLVFNDVSSQYLLRETAANSKRDLEAIMDHFPATVYVKDLNGCYLFINKKFAALFKLSRDNIIGKTAYDFFPKDIAARMHNDEQSILRTAKLMESEEVTPLEDGLHTYFSIKFPLLNESKEIYAICGISTDITARKLQDEQIQRSQKMDAIGKMTGGIAHDYNNMLGVVLGYANLLSNELDNQPKLKSYANEIERASERGTKLTQKILAISCRKSVDIQKIDINSTILDEQNMLEKTLTARVKLVLDLEKNLPPVWLDGAELADAILNLCINAMHAIDKRGQLTIQTSIKKIYKSDARILQLTPGDYILLNVSDTGCGMNAKTKEKIFDPFYTTKGDKGTGLGLSQVYRFIERCNGSIQVSSELGQGTRFSLYFPMHDNLQLDKKSIIEKSLIKTDKLTNLKGSETILVIDDERALRELAREILEAHGYRIFCADNAAQTMKILETNTIDLLLSDVIMPDIDGYQLATDVRKKYPNVKIQMVSGFQDDLQVKSSHDNEFFNLLHKPYHLQTLLVTVRKILDA